MHVLLDTHVFAWSLIAPNALPSRALNALQSGASVFVPPIAFYEIAQKVRLGKWPAMDQHVDRLDALCAAQGFRVAPYTARMAVLAGRLDWPHRDPFDRMIATTATEMGCALLSKDTIFDSLPALPGWVGRVWD